MKKKFFGFLLIVSLVVVVTACNDKKEDKNKKGKIDYNAVYKLGKNKVKTYKMGDTIYYKAESPEVNNTGNSELNKNKIKLDNIAEGATLTFKNNSALVKADINLKSGTYKKEGKYKKEDFYATSEINGIYIKDDFRVYIYQRSESEIRLFYTLEEASSDLTLDLDEDGDYYLEFFDDIYIISFIDDSMVIYLETDDEEHQILSGTYTKETSLGVAEIINEYEPY